jgi:hypothetical protein
MIVFAVLIVLGMIVATALGLIDVLILSAVFAISTGRLSGRDTLWVSLFLAFGAIMTFADAFGVWSLTRL